MHSTACSARTHPLLARLRNAGMNLTSRIPVAKTVLIRYAAGLI